MAKMLRRGRSEAPFLDQKMQCFQSDSINLIEHIPPDVRRWFPPRTRRLREHFHHFWQTEAIPQTRKVLLLSKRLLCGHKLPESQKLERQPHHPPQVQPHRNQQRLSIERHFLKHQRNPESSITPAANRKSNRLYAKIRHHTEHTELHADSTGNTAYHPTPARTHLATTANQPRQRHHTPKTARRHRTTQSRIGFAKHHKFTYRSITQRRSAKSASDPP